MTEGATSTPYVEDGTDSVPPEERLTVGHRALIARERADGRYEIHRSQWAGADLSLAHELANGTWPPPGTETDPVATGVPWTDLLANRLDALLHEALYVVGADGAVRAYRTCWLGHASDGPGGDGPQGLLVGVRWADHCDDVRVRAWFRGASAVTERAVRDGDVADPATAPTLVERCLREWAADREVVRVP